MKVIRRIVGSIETNCYIVVNEALAECFIIDPGAEADVIDEAVRDSEARVSAILLTHGHFDHIGAVQELEDKYNVPVYAPLKEATLLSDPSLNCSVMAYGYPISVTPQKYIEDDDVFTIAGFEIKAIETPGHTRGSMCFLLKKECVLFSGDTLFKGSVGRTDLPTGNTHLLIESLRDKIIILPSSTRIFPGHGPETTLEYEKKNNSYMYGDSFKE